MNNTGEAKMDAAETIRAWIKFRTDELNYEQANQAIHPMSAGSSIMRGERMKQVAVILAELELFATWLDNGGPKEFVPPMSEESKKEWRFARNHGADVPPHILAQL